VRFACLPVDVPLDRLPPVLPPRPTRGRAPDQRGDVLVASCALVRAGTAGTGSGRCLPPPWVPCVRARWYLVQNGVRDEQNVHHGKPGDEPGERQHPLRLRLRIAPG
jgi:hypothetical protein